MVKGLDVFRRYFVDYADRYVLIGGVAASIAMEDAGLDFRKTKDLDIVLIVEALDAEFASLFWRFITDGGYEIRQRSDGAPQFYRFQRPADDSFPVMLELFSRIPEGLALTEESHLTPLPVDEAVSSLSAILLDQDYYDFILGGRNATDEISWVGPDRLIPLKANAWLDLSRRLADGEQIDGKNVRKHRNDVLVLSQLLSPGIAINLPAKVADDLALFLGVLPHEPIDLKHLDMGHTDLQTVVSRIRGVFGLG